METAVPLVYRLCFCVSGLNMRTPRELCNTLNYHTLKIKANFYRCLQPEKCSWLHLNAGQFLTQ